MSTQLAGPARLVVHANVIEMLPCSLYAGHLSAVIEAHHICPKSWWVKAGLTPSSPMADLCGLCHNNVHAAIDGLILKRDVTRLPPRAIAMAHRGLVIAADSGLTPALTL